MKKIVNFIKSNLKLLLKIFWYLHKPLVFSNKKLRNIHKGETCFIFANGGSLKYYDISKLPDNPSIVCAYALMDKRTEALNIKYYVTTDSYSLYSILFNTYPHIRKFQKNKIRPIFKELFQKHKDIRIFANITNFYSLICRRKKISYFHYFNDENSFNDDLAGNFSNIRAALDTMLGVAKFLGFKKAILIGCDYLGTPPMLGHFYADYEPFEHSSEDYSEYRARVQKAAEGIDVCVILPEGITSPDFEFDSYENYFKIDREYKENKDFIDDSFLDMLRDAANSNQTVMQRDLDNV